MMLVEPPVLGGHKGLLHGFGDVIERHPDAPVARLEDVGKIRAFAVEDGAHARQLPALEPRMVGQIGRGVVEELDHLAEIDHRIADILVLAEPVIGDVQVSEIDAMKGLDVGANRLLVVERGGDEVIEVDRFDVERPAHMGAAGAQGLHHLVLVGHGIEMGLPCLRLSHHFAQRERGRKDLDEDQVHGLPHARRESTCCAQRSQHGAGSLLGVRIGPHGIRASTTLLQVVTEDEIVWLPLHFALFSLG
jgi:hypothetical protein